MECLERIEVKKCPKVRVQAIIELGFTADLQLLTPRVGPRPMENSHPQAHHSVTEQ